MSLQNTPRIMVSRALKMDARFDLVPDVSYYLSQVMRRKVGDLIRLFNGRDGEFIAKIRMVKKMLVEVEITEVYRPQQDGPDLWLVFALIKKHRLEAMLEKASELGVARLFPISTRYSNAPLPKASRLELILNEAAEQSERMDAPLLEEQSSLDKMLDQWPEDRTLYACLETGQSVPLHDCLKEGKRGEKAAILIGPEGGFAEEEILRLKSCPFVKAVSLGPRILKADTAAIYALSLFQAHCGDGDQFPPRLMN